MFNVEHGIALHTVQGNWASSCGKGEVSWFFSSCPGTWAIFSRYDGDGRVCSATSRLLASCEGHPGILLEAWQGNRDGIQCKARDQVSLSRCQRDIGIPLNFQVSQVSCTFEALNSLCL